MTSTQSGFNTRAYGPLRKITGHAGVGGRLAYEVLECGHFGEGHKLAGRSVEQVQESWTWMVEAGLKVKTSRRCHQCGVAAGITERDITKA